MCVSGVTVDWRKVPRRERRIKGAVFRLFTPLMAPPKIQIESFGKKEMYLLKKDVTIEEK